jgi:membrane protein required for colicin V production
MNVTDYLVIVAVIISAVIGAMRGFLREAVALVTWLLALFIAWHFADLIEPHLGGLLAGSYVKTWAARVIIVVLVLLIGAGIGAVLNHFVRLSIFSGMDRFLGMVFGLFRGVVLLGVFVILGQLLRLDGEKWWTRSLLIPYGESVANGLRALVGEQRVRHAGHVTAKF